MFQLIAKEWENSSPEFYLLDDDFIVKFSFLKMGDFEKIVINEYSKRNLPIGKNLALYILWGIKRTNAKIEHMLKYQDKNLAECFPNLWDQIKEERDKYLEKYIPFS